MARKLAEAHGLGDHEVIVAREQLEVLQDRVALLAQAVADLERDGAERGQGVEELQGSLEWLLAHARDVATTRIEPMWGERVGLI